jgi:hypothetical protein
MIKGLLTIIYLSSPPDNFVEQFKDLEACKIEASRIVPLINANPDVKGVAFVCEPVGEPA